MILESMPNEILLEIFEHLNSWDLINSFYDLNRRFNAMIDGMELNLDLSIVQKTKFVEICRKILPRFSGKISSIKLSNKKTINAIELFLDETKTNDQMFLKKLVLVEPKIEEFRGLMKKFPPLTDLKIRTNDFLKIRIDEIPLRLVNCLMSNCQIDVSSIGLGQKFESIEQLEVKISNGQDFLTILDSMPYLRKFHCQISDTSSAVIESRSNDSLKSLQDVKLSIGSISFDFVESFLERCQNLVTLAYNYTSGVQSTFDDEHIDVERWNRLFNEKLISLKNLNLHISLNIDKRRDFASIGKSFQQLKFYRENQIEIIYEMTSYKQILCTLQKFRYQNNVQSKRIENEYSRIHHFDLILNEAMISQQQHILRCPTIHSFHLGLYKKMTPIEQQSRILLNQSISFVYLKHFELHGTCLNDGFIGQLLAQMNQLDSLTLPFNQLPSCCVNSTVTQNMKRIRKLQLALTESIKLDTIRNFIIPIFTNLHEIIFAIDNKLQTINEILSLIRQKSNTSRYLEFLTFMEVFSLDQDWKQTMLLEIEPFVRFQHNHRILYIWL